MKRILDQLGILYELREYETDADDLTANGVAARIRLPPEQVFWSVRRTFRQAATLTTPSPRRQVSCRRLSRQVAQSQAPKNGLPGN